METEFATPPETPYKVADIHQTKIDEALYTLSIHYDYKFDDIIAPLQHFLKYYSFMFPECSNVLISYEDVAFCRNRFAYVDYLKWKEDQQGKTKKFTKQEIETQIRERTSEMQQSIDTLQDEVDDLKSKTFDQEKLIAELKIKHKEELEIREKTELHNKNLQSDMKQLNKEMQVLRNEVDMYREQFNAKQKEKHDQISQSYKNGDNHPSGFSIFKDSLKDDIDKIYSSVKDNIPKIESDNEEEDDELEIYKTNLPPPTEFENSIGRSFFPNDLVSSKKPTVSASTLSTKQDASVFKRLNSTSIQKSDASKVDSISSHNMKVHNFSDDIMKRAEADFENALENDSEFQNDIKISTPKVKEVSLDAISRDIENREDQWNQEFDAALKRASESNTGTLTTNLNITNLLSNINLNGILESIDSNSALKNNASNDNKIASSIQSISTPNSSREDRRRRRQMDVFEHDD